MHDHTTKIVSIIKPCSLETKKTECVTSKCSGLHIAKCKECFQQSEVFPLENKTNMPFKHLFPMKQFT